MGQSAHHKGVRPEPEAWASSPSDCRSPGTPMQHGRITAAIRACRRGGPTGSPRPGCTVSSTSTGTAAGSTPAQGAIPKTYPTFTPEAERKFRRIGDRSPPSSPVKNEKLIFEALNEETSFNKRGLAEKPYERLTRVNQLFIDTVRKTGGNNAKRLLIVPGYTTDIDKTRADTGCPKTPSHRLFLSVHYYTPWQFAGMTEDASWGKMSPPGAASRYQANSTAVRPMNEFSSATTSRPSLASSRERRRRRLRACAG